MFGKLLQEIPVFKASRQTAQLTPPAHPNPTPRGHVRRPNPETPRRIAASLSTRPHAANPKHPNPQSSPLRLRQSLSTRPHAARRRPPQLARAAFPPLRLSLSDSQSLSTLKRLSSSPLLGSWRLAAWPPSVPPGALPGGLAVRRGDNRSTTWGLGRQAGRQDEATTK